MKFKEVKLRDIETRNGYGSVDGPFGSNLPASSYTDTGVPVIRGVNLSLGNQRFKDEDYVFISEDLSKKLSRSSCKSEDIIFTKKGTLGQTGIVPKNSKYKEFILSSNQMRLRVETSIAEPLYVYYWVSSPYSRSRILADAMTSGVPKINLGYLRSFKILLPPLETQKKIAAILSAYDDLIETNKQRIALLEKMAEEIYREWFVRFRFPGWQNTEFEKGIPKGWEIKRIDSLGKVVTGKTPPTTNEKFYNGEIHFIKTPDMHDSLFILDTQEKLSIDGLNSQPSQIIPENSICVSCIGTGGIVSITTQKCSTNQQINSVVLKNSFKLEFAFYTLKSLKETINLFGSTGATMTNLSKGKFSGIKFIAPDDFLIQSFHDKIGHMFKQVQQLSTINQNLEKTKSTLLPRLISGKLSVENLDIEFPPSLQ